MKYLIFIALMLLSAACDTEVESLIPPVLKEPVIGPGSVTFDVPVGNVSADGIAFKDVKLRVTDPNATGKMVTFSISPVGIFDNGKNTFITPLFISGTQYEAGVKVLSTNEGRATITARIDDVEKADFITFEKAVPLYNLSFGPILPNTPADNYSFAEITLTATPVSGVIQAKGVKFITDKGTFDNGSKEFLTTLTSANMATARVKHNEAETVRVTAIIADTDPKVAVIPFVHAVPERVIITSKIDPISPALGSSTEITAKLERATGTVSKGQKVIFSCELAGQPIEGFFNYTLSNDKEEVKATFKLTSAIPSGQLPALLYIKAYLNSGNPGVQIPINGSNTIVVQ